MLKSHAEIDSVFRSLLDQNTQNSRITCSSSNKEIMLSKSFENSTLFYTNWSPLRHSPKLKTSFGKLVYLCADYSDLGEDFIMNSSLADKVLVIPKSMVEEVRKICGEKTEAFPQLVSSFQPRSVLSGRVQQFLKEIPPPRIVYSGETGRRIDMELFSSAMKELKFCFSFRFIPVLLKRMRTSSNCPGWEIEIFQVLENSQVGCMPYDVKISHNLHCVPLKLLNIFNSVCQWWVRRW